MSPRLWEQVQTAFAEVADLHGEDRAARLRAVAADAEVRREVESLLEAAERAGSFLDRPRIEIDLAAHRARDLGPESVVGSYRITRLLDSGGMGHVYLARRNDGAYEQLVALKVLKSHLASPDLVARFHRERQVLAGLQHPHIARLLDGGTTTDGRPYLVLEYVEGEPLTDWCDKRRATVTARIDLFIRVASAVQHAHRNLIVHRDLKPANILVNAEGDPRLLDFGIAKILVSGSPARDQTHSPDRAMTPRYASPEQVRGETITTASDVFSLGLILHEILTGQNPFDPTGAASDFDIRLAISRSNPTRPSSALAGRAASREIADARSCRPDELVRMIRGDLDLIVLKALHREPERRYATVDALIEDLRRFNRCEPVSARPDTIPYRASKFVRRHPLGSALSCLALLLILTASIAATALGVHADVERRRADHRATEAEWNAYVANLAAASGALESGVSTAAKTRLDQVPAHLRGWEWRHLMSRVDQSVVWFKDRPRMNGLDLSADRRRIAVGCEGSTFVVDAATRDIVRQFKHGTTVSRLAFEPGDESVVWAGNGSLWRGNIGTGEFKRILRDSAGIESVAVHAPWLFLGRRDGRLRIMDQSTLAEISLLDSIGGGMKSIAVSPCGRWVAANGAQGIHVWRTGDWAPVALLQGHRDGVMEMCFSPDGSRLASGDVTGEVRQWSIETGEPIGYPIDAAGQAWALSFSPDGNELAIGGRRSIQFFDLVDGVRTGRAHLLSWPVRISYLDGDTLIVAGYDDLRSLDRHASGSVALRGAKPVTVAAFIPGTRQIRSNRGTWSIDAASLLADAPLQDQDHERPTMFRFNAAGDRYLSVRGSIVVIRADDGSLLASRGAEKVGRRTWYWSADFQPGTNLVAAAGRKGEQVELLDGETLEVRHSLTEGETEWTHDLRFNPDGALLATVTDRLGLRIWNVMSGDLVAHPEPHRGIDRAVAWSADGSLLAAGGYGEDLILWETATWTIAGRCATNSDIVTHVAFHPTEPRLAMGDDREARLLALPSAREVFALPAHAGSLRSLEWSRDGTTLLTSGADGTLRLWSAPPSAEGTGLSPDPTMAGLNDELDAQEQSRE